MRPLVLFPLLFSLVLSQDLAAFVNLFIGTTDGGHVFPGRYFYHLKRAHILQAKDHVFVACMLNKPRS